MTKALAPVLADYIKAQVAPLQKQIAELEARLADVPRYRGVWIEGQTYRAGSFVTYDGSLWHCNAPTVSRPGSGDAAWTLAVKSPRPPK
jgi:hypothetical protein